MRQFCIFFVAVVIYFVGIAPAFGQECRQLPPIVIQQIEGIGGNHCLRSPSLISAAIGDRLAASRWPKYTRSPNNDCHTGLYINYNLNVLERTESSNNGWNANPLQFFPELRQFCLNYSQNASDVRTRYVCGIEIWGILDTVSNDGRIEIARGRGGSAGAFEYLPYQV